jgi:hypothetical protein
MEGPMPLKDENCKHENLILGSYQVGNANTSVTLTREATTGKVFDFEFNRIDGEVSDPVFYCTDCEGEFGWEEVREF